MTVLAVTGVVAVIALSYSTTYRQSAQFGNDVRNFNHSVRLARITAIQYQQNVRVVVRPSAGAVGWQATNYAVGAIVLNKSATYTRIQEASTAPGYPHNSNPPEPGVGTDWSLYWILTIDFQYDTVRNIMKECVDATTAFSGCTDANPYTPSAPVHIDFNSRGFTTDYGQHFIRIRGHDTGIKAGEVAVQFIISPLGIIDQRAG